MKALIKEQKLGEAEQGGTGSTEVSRKGSVSQLREVQRLGDTELKTVIL